MTWRENLRQASFRNIPFKVDTAETSGGRRIVTHEYPNRNTPYSENLGRKAREYQIQAYVIGDNYQDLRDRLLDAIELRSEPGVLVHPTLGTLKVLCKDYRLRYDNHEGGLEYFDLTFVEAGENVNPDTRQFTAEAVKGAADEAVNEIKSVFAAIVTPNGLPEFVAGDILLDSEDLADQVTLAAGIGARDPEQTAVLLEDVITFRNDLPEFIQEPATLADTVAGLILRVRQVYPSAMTAYRAFRNLLAFGDNLPTIPQTTTTRRQQAANREAFVSLVRQASLAGMAQSITAIDFDSYDSAVAVRDEFTDFLDREIIALGSTDFDRAFQQMETLRTAVVQEVTQRAANLERIKTLTLASTLPALVVAYDLYEDAARDDEIVKRNRIPHPGFLPPGTPLQVLTA
jgi:prophage DNA circulation protein